MTKRFFHFCWPWTRINLIICNNNYYSRLHFAIYASSKSKMISCSRIYLPWIYASRRTTYTIEHAIIVLVLRIVLKLYIYHVSLHFTLHIRALIDYKMRNRYILPPYASSLSIFQCCRNVRRRRSKSILFVKNYLSNSSFDCNDVGSPFYFHLRKILNVLSRNCLKILMWTETLPSIPSPSRLTFVKSSIYLCRQSN